MVSQLICFAPEQRRMLDLICKGRGINIEMAKRWQTGYAPNAWDALVRWANGAGFTKEELVESGLAKIARRRKCSLEYLRSISRPADISDLQ